MIFFTLGPAIYTSLVASVTTKRSVKARKEKEKERERDKRESRKKSFD